MLVLGFEGYGGRAVNPSEMIVRSLDGQTVAGHRVMGAVLPVRYATLVESATALIHQHRPSAVIGIGLWPGEPLIRIERVAVNDNAFEIGDNSGALEAGSISPGGPDGRLTTLPVRAIRDAMLGAGIPARLSGTAGSFLCNAMMYSILGAAEGLDPVPKAGFIHVPYLPEQVAGMIEEIRDGHELELHQRADLASMSLETMVRGVEIAIGETLEL